MLRKSTIALATAAALAAPSAFADSKNVDIYGVVAFYTYSLDNSVDTVTTLENESRIGFRGSKDLKNGPKMIWQMETGFLGYAGNDIGARDTFVGVEGELGKLRAGRMLTALYETIDWPYSNPGLGNIFDWGSSVRGGYNYDRQSDQIRWDTPTAGPFSASLSAGRGNDRNVSGNNFVSAIAHVKAGPVTVHAGYEQGSKRLVDATTLERSDTDAGLVGFEAGITKEVSLYGAYKLGKAEYSTNAPEEEQASWVFGAIYTTGDWQFKLAYAKNEDKEVGGSTVEETNASILALQALYFVDPSAVAYIRLRDVDNSANTANVTGLTGKDGKVLMLGMEYYF